MSDEKALVPNMGAAFDLILGGETLDKVVETYKLDKKAFEKYFRKRFGELTPEQQQERAMQLGQLNSLMKSWWVFAHGDPKFGQMYLNALKRRQELIFPNLPGGITPEKLGDVIDLERVQQVVKESKQRKKDAHRLERDGKVGAMEGRESRLSATGDDDAAKASDTPNDE